MKKIALAAVLAALMAGCGVLQPEPPNPVQFNYVTSPPADSGLVRVFNLNGNTILQFKDLIAVQPKVSSSAGASLAYTVVGQYAVVTGQQPMLKIEANGSTVNALQLASSIPAASVASTLTAAAVPNRVDLPGLAEVPAVTQAPGTPMEQMMRELQEARKELAAARKDLAALQKVNIEPVPVLPPLDESRRTWTLEGQKTLKENMANIAKSAGYSEVNWKAGNPFMVRGTTAYPALTFLEFLQKITETVPTLEFKVSKTKRTVDVIDAGTTAGA